MSKIKHSLRPSEGRTWKAISAALESIGKDVIKFARARIRSGGPDHLGRPWKSWSLSWKNDPRSNKMLFMSGRMFDNLDYAANPLRRSVRIHTDSVAYGDLQDRHRPFIEPSKAELVQIEDSAKEAIERELARMIGGKS